MDVCKLCKLQSIIFWVSYFKENLFNLCYHNVYNKVAFIIPQVSIVNLQMTTAAVTQRGECFVIYKRYLLKITLALRKDASNI